MRDLKTLKEDPPRAAVAMAPRRPKETHLNGIIRDITDQKARDARFQDSEEGYRLLVDHLGVATFTLALEPGPHLTFVSQRVEELLGFPTDRWLDDGSFLWSRIHSQDRRGVLRAFRRARTGGALKDLTFRILGSGDRVLWVRVHASALFLGTGEPVFQGILSNITDLKGAELERDLLSAAMEQSESLVLITDLEGRTLYANRAFETITGYTREEVMGRNPRVLLGGVERKEADRKMWESLREGETQKQEFENRKKDGSAFFTRASISPVHDGRGRVTHIVGISHDITAERERETQLRQMQKMETVGQLTGGIAHDMNNILSAVMSYTTLARDELEPGQTAIAGDLREVAAAARRGSELIGKLMAFSRREHLRYRVLDAEKVVLGLEGMLSRLLPANLRITMSTEGTGAWCRADEGALEQILMNLATNARDAVTGPGELRILVDQLSVGSIPRDASHRPAPGPFVRIRVRDTGEGMSEEVLGRAFEPFFTTKPVGKGTGMGMAVIHGLVGQHGGFLTVESAPGEGTTVSVHLPATLPLIPSESMALPGRQRGEG